jgi:hypothetical protein
LLGEFTPGTGTGAEEFGASVAYNSVAGYGGGGPIRIGNLAVGAPGTNVDQGSAYGFDLLANGDGEA